MRKGQKGKRGAHHKGIDDIRLMLIWTLPPDRVRALRDRGVENLPTRVCTDYDIDGESQFDDGDVA